MAKFAAASGLVLAAALVFAVPAKAQGFFSFFEVSPRQVVGMLEDEGYRLRGPMMRRGDVYVVNVASVSGRQARLIVSARDGRILERYAAEPRNRGYDDETTRVERTSRSWGDEGDERARRGQFAMGDLFTPPSRVYGNDSMFSSKPTPPASVPDVDAPKSKHRAAKKHKDTNVARTPAAPAPDATPAADAPKPAEGAVAAVAPNAPPEPKKPVAEPVKPAAPVEAPKPAAEAPKPAPEVEKRATAEPPAPAPAPVKPKVEPPKKKLNDLPVGTLD